MLKNDYFMLLDFILLISYYNCGKKNINIVPEHYTF